MRTLIIGPLAARQGTVARSLRLLAARLLLASVAAAAFMYFALVLLSGERTVAMRGCTREELIGRNVRECRPREDPAALPALLAAVWPDEGTVFETLHRRRDGSVVPIEMPSRTMRLDGDEVLLSAFRGIMERKRAEEALQQRTAELAARNEELMRFDRAAACRETRMVELRQVVKEAIR